MTETITGEVIHVVGPEDHEDAKLVDELSMLAESRYVLVCREGGTPSVFERVLAFLRRDPIRPITIVADEEVSEGTELTVTVHETGMNNVYEAVEPR